MLRASWLVPAPHGFGPLSADAQAFARQTGAALNGVETIQQAAKTLPVQDNVQTLKKAGWTSEVEETWSPTVSPPSNDISTFLGVKVAQFDSEAQASALQQRVVSGYSVPASVGIPGFVPPKTSSMPQIPGAVEIFGSNSGSETVNIVYVRGPYFVATYGLTTSTSKVKPLRAVATAVAVDQYKRLPRS